MILIGLISESSSTGRTEDDYSVEHQRTDIIAKSAQPNCKHKWVLFKDRTINNFRNGQEVQVGYVKFYECEHCKKMKREKVEL